MQNNTAKKRSVAAIAIIAAVFAVFLVNLFRIQIFEADSQKSAVSSVEVPVNPVRGEIFDRDGYPLVVNKQVNAIVFHHQTFPAASDAKARNKVILSLIELFNKNGLEWKDNLPIEVKNGKLKFVRDKQTEIEYLKSKAFLDLNYYATVEDCFNALCQRYELTEYPLKKARDIASVYYSMVKDGFNSGNPYVFAKQVPGEAVAVIKENSAVYVGVDVQVQSEREYTDGTVAPHILGLVGMISPEEYEKKKDEGYSLNDVIGKNGIEYAMEDKLRGEAGVKAILTDSDGNTSEVYTKQPVHGDNIILTIKRDLQITAQNSLEELIKRLQKTKPNVNAGAVVVMDTRTNEVLALANYPSFNLADYYENADKLNKDPLKPLWNRALRSIYTPGSTIKPAVAMGGLEEGVITPDTTIYCNGIYRHYKDYQPRCTGYHKNQDVVHALFNSCNIFFYETARLLGIEKVNQYYSAFGLGSKTGVELSENEGVLDSPEYRAKKGDLWTPGLTVQAGIGHGDNQVTPIQLCSYVSVIANRGVRYRAHFIKSVMNYDYSKTVMQSRTQVLSEANFSVRNWNLIQSGMLLVGTKGYADFSKVPCRVAAKTGTTSIHHMINGRDVEINNGFLISYAPYEKPEIAVAVVIEGTNSGGSTAPVVSDIMQEYFKTEEPENTMQNEGTLLK